LLVSRLLITTALKLFRSSGWNSRKVLLVGTDSTAQELVQRVKATSWAGIEINGFIDDSAEIGSLVVGEPVKGGINDIDAVVTREKIDEVWVVLPITMKEAVLEILRKLQYATVDVRYFLDFKDFRLMNHSISEIMGVPVVNLTESPMHGINRLIKAIEDRLLSAVILVVISPLLLLIALLVKFTSPGPVLFKQMRHGWDGKKIKVYKFRTMYVHQEEAGKVTQAGRQDKRVTPLGGFLRRTSLDELPQFFNVLQGRMSIVGPRPHAVQHNEYYKEQIEAYMLRHKVKPGITGWAQVNGWRGETDSLEKMQKRVEYDIFYIENWSLWFDVQIMLMTLFKGFVNKNAY
jgi:putative colanic acid biosynthesis UDP-glucose lipid carrier transferase